MFAGVRSTTGATPDWLVDGVGAAGVAGGGAGAAVAAVWVVVALRVVEVRTGVAAGLAATWDVRTVFVLVVFVAAGAEVVEVSVVVVLVSGAAGADSVTGGVVTGVDCVTGSVVEVGTC